LALAQSFDAPLSMRPLESPADLRTSWNQVDVLTLASPPSQRYALGIAQSDRTLLEVFRLRYQVFNVEMGEGLASSNRDGLDRDAYDAQMTHLLVVDLATGRVVGTYRIQTVRHALAHRGIYSAQEFDLAPLEPMFDRLVECGRACLAREHRNLDAILQLWHGLGEFMSMHRHQYLFGCCSLTTRDPDDGWRAMKTIRGKGFLHDDILARAMPDYTCGDPTRELDPALGDPVFLPKLFRIYIKLGAKVISEPAIDRAFGTVDFLVVIDGLKVALSKLSVVI
jgi:putative hemolysin